jgi:hypothetical protein
MDDINSNPIFIEFTKKKGIVSPIRASFLDPRRYEFANGVLNRTAELAKSDPNTIIGYFAACSDFDPDDPQKTIGISFIRPEDYRADFDKDISKIRAIAMAMNVDKSIPNGALRLDSVMVGNGSAVYIFKNSIREQFGEFVGRCQRYFKK